MCSRSANFFVGTVVVLVLYVASIGPVGAVKRRFDQPPYLVLQVFYAPMLLLEGRQPMDGWIQAYMDFCEGLLK